LEWSFVRLKEVDSTQSYADRLADEGAKEGTVVVAERQTKGRGRTGRVWASPQGGIYMSIVLKPPRMQGVQLITLLVAAAVVEGVRISTQVNSQVRWPNDVMVGGRKLGGVIAESKFNGEKAHHVTVGIGVNCNSPSTELGEASSVSTSLREALGREVEVPKTRDAILSALASSYKDWLHGADPVELVRPLTATLGKDVEVRFRSSDNPVTLKAVDISPTGGLVAQKQEEEITLFAEDIDWLREK